MQVLLTNSNIVSRFTFEYPRLESKIVVIMHNKFDTIIYKFDAPIKYKSKIYKITDQYFRRRGWR